MKKYWWVHHESECLGFEFKEDKIYQMMETELIEPITEKQAQYYINNDYHFDMKELLRDHRKEV